MTVAWIGKDQHERERQHRLARSQPLRWRAWWKRWWRAVLWTASASLIAAVWIVVTRVF